MIDDRTTKDEDLEAFVEQARAVIAADDPPPASASALARMAFELRDLPTIDGNVLENDAALAGIRGTATPELVHHGDVTLTWVREDDSLRGLLDPETPQTNVALEIQTADALESVVIEDDGSFRHRLKSGPCRFVVRSAAGDWATPWTAYLA